MRQETYNFTHEIEVVPQEGIAFEMFSAGDIKITMMSDAEFGEIGISSAGWALLEVGGKTVPVARGDEAFPISSERGQEVLALLRRSSDFSAGRQARVSTPDGFGPAATDALAQQLQRQWPAHPPAASWDVATVMLLWRESGGNPAGTVRYA